MNRSRLMLLFGLSAFGLGQPAFAQDGQTYTVGTCTMVCQIWRSIAGTATVEAPAVPTAPYVMPLSREEVEPPVPSKIVAARGVVMAETDAERKKRKRQYTLMLNSIVPAAGRQSMTKDASPQAAAH